MHRQGRARESLELRALRRTVLACDETLARAAWQELGRLAANVGWARRFVSDVARGRLALPPEAAVPALTELARADPELTSDLLGPNPTAAVPLMMALGRATGRFHDELAALAVRPEVATRLAAVAGLGEEAAGGLAMAVDELAKRLADPAGEVRAAAAEALGKARGQEATAQALEWLAKAVTGDDRVVSGAALGAVALWPAARKEAEAVLRLVVESGPAGRRAVAAAIGGLRSGGMRIAGELARDRDAEVRRLCAVALVRRAANGSRAAWSYAQRLASDPSPAVRAACAGALAGWPEGRELLMPLSEDRSRAVRVAAAACLADCEPAEARAPLLRLAADPAGAVRAEAYRSLGALGLRGAAARGHLDREPMVRAAAAMALEPRDAREAKLLLSLSRDRHAEVAQAAARELAGRVVALNCPVRRRVAELAHDELTVTAVAEGLAWALDRDAKAALEACASLPLGEVRPGLLWMIARSAQTAEAADLARAAARVMEGGDDVGEGLRDLSVALDAVGCHEVAKRCIWLAECADAETIEQIGSVTSAPKVEFGPASYLATAARLVKRAAKARERRTHDLCLARARAALSLCADRCTGLAWWPAIQPILTTWRAALDSNLASEVNKRSVDAPRAVRRERRSGAAMTPTFPLGAAPNPYVVGAPLSGDSGMFFGREDDLVFVERALDSGESGAVAVLVGQRRTGKTSLLRRLEARLRGSYRYHPTFVDVQGMLVADTGAFFRELARQTLAGEAPILSDGGQVSGAGAEVVREAAGLVGRRVVLLLDEFDDLEQKVRTGLLSPEVFSQLRHLIQHCPEVSVVLCGTHRLEELAGEHWSFLLNQAIYRRVGALDPEAAEDALRRPLGSLGIGCDDAALADVLALTGRHPYFLQLLGYRLVERLVERGDHEVDRGLVAQIADDVIEQGAIHLSYLWQIAGRHGQPIVRTLAAAGNAMSAEELASATGSRLAHLYTSLKELEALELIEERAGRYFVRVGLL